MRVLSLATIGFFLCLEVSSCKQAPDQPKTKPPAEPVKQAEQTVDTKPSTVEAAGEEDATLSIVSATSSSLGIELTNRVPIRGVQFTLKGAAMREIRTTTRSKDFLADFNREAGKVVILSASGDKIAAGSGLIAEVVCDSIEGASLSEIKLVK